MLKMFLVRTSYSEAEKERLANKFMDCVASTSRLKPYHMSVIELKKYLTRNWDSVYSSLVAKYNEDCLERCCYEWLEVLNINEEKLNLDGDSVFSTNANSNFDIISSYSSNPSLQFPVFTNHSVIEDTIVVVPETVSSIARKELVLRESYKDKLNLYFDPKRKFINLKKLSDEQDRAEEEVYRRTKLNLKVKIIKEKAFENVLRKVQENRKTANAIKEDNQLLFQRNLKKLELEFNGKVLVAQQIQLERENAKSAVESAIKAKSLKAIEVRNASLASKINIDRNTANDLYEKRALVKKIKELQSQICTPDLDVTITFLSALTIDELKTKMEKLRSEKQNQLLLAREAVMQTRCKQKSERNQKLTNLSLLKNKILDVKSLDLRCDSQISIYSNPKMQNQQLEIESLQTELKRLLHK